MHPCSCSPDEICPLFQHLVYTHRKWSKSRGSTRGFYTSGRWSKSCRALTSGELLQSSELTDRPILFHKSKRQAPFLTVFRTLEFLTKHLAHLATLSTQTNMHARNLALVWAPNLLRQVHPHSCFSWSLSTFKVMLTLEFLFLVFFLSSDVRTSRSRRVTETWPSRRCGYSNRWSNLF